MNLHTSATHPLQIASLDTLTGGRIGMTFCPGKHDLTAMTGAWSRDLAADLDAIAAWGAGALVTLMEDHELVHLGVHDIGVRTRALGMAWYHLPIRDVSIPGADFETAWTMSGSELKQRLRAGDGIVVHCRGGLGRTGLVAARLLIELGEAPEKALQRVRAARPGAVETSEQEDFVLHTVPEISSDARA